jgi:hypothetical protein
MPKKIATMGAALIVVSGVVNTILGAKIGAVLYEIYPGGKMGHVGVIAGVAALVVGFVIVFIAVPLYRHGNRRLVVAGGTLTVILGHVGAVAGALYIGTLGALLCYIAGLWVIVAAWKSAKSDKEH